MMTPFKRPSVELRKTFIRQSRARLFESPLMRNRRRNLRALAEKARVREVERKKQEKEARRAQGLIGRVRRAIGA